jgi:hypothetical protein
MKNGLTCQTYGCKQHEALVNFATISKPQTFGNQDAENQELGQWKQEPCRVTARQAGSRKRSNDIATEVVAASRKIYKDKAAQDYHCGCKHRTSNSQAAMNGCPPGRNKTRLNEKQQDPRDKDDTVRSHKHSRWPVPPGLDDDGRSEPSGTEENHEQRDVNVKPALDPQAVFRHYHCSVWIGHLYISSRG